MIGRSPREPPQLHNKTLRRQRQLRPGACMGPVLGGKTWMQFAPPLLTNLHMRERQIHYKRGTPISPESFTLFIKSVTKHLQLHRSATNYRRLYIRSASPQRLACCLPVLQQLGGWHLFIHSLINIAGLIVLENCIEKYRAVKNRPAR